MMPHQAVLTIPVPGTYLPEQGGLFAGIQIEGDRIFYLIVPRPEEFSLRGEYLRSYDEITGADSEDDGLANTIAMAQAGSPIAIMTRACRLGGFDDWCIPARKQARITLLYAPAAFPDEWIWTSTQYSAHSAWYQNSNGAQYWTNKDSEGAVVPVRRLSAIE